MAEPYRSKEKTSEASNPKKEWIFYLPKAYHPLLLQQHREKLSTAQRNVRSAAAVSNIFLTLVVLNLYLSENTF